MPNPGMSLYLNTANYIAGLMSINSMTSKWGKLTTNQVSVVKSAYDSLTQVFTKTASSASSQVAQTIQATNGLTAAMTIANAAGNLLAGAARGIWNSLRQMSGALLEAISNFQLYKLRIEGIIAIDWNRAFGIPIEEALSKASAKAQELLKWIKLFAFATPFSAQQIADTYSQATAWGFAAEEAKALTEAMANLVAGRGIDPSKFEAISYALGQIKAAGRVLQTELRQLSEAFVPVNDILQIVADKFGLTIAEAKGQLRLGQISVQEFFEAFAQYAGQFEGAAQRMTNTLVGVKEKWKDFTSVIIGTEMLGPVLDRITTALSTFMNSLVSESTLNAASTIGKSLGLAFDTLLPSVNALFKSFKELFGVLIGIANVISPITRAFNWLIKSLSLTNQEIDQIANTFAKGATSGKVFTDAVTFMRSTLGRVITVFIYAIEIIKAFTGAISTGISNLAAGIQSGLGPLAQQFGDWLWNTLGLPIDTMSNDMFEWGAELVTNFATGIIQAAGAVLTAAAQYIGNILASWLSPGSPPKILPDIDNWGMETMAEWLRGFTMADFSVLDSIQSPLRGALDALAGLGELAKEDVGGIFTGISEDIIKMLATIRAGGEVDAKVFEELRNIGGGFGAELEKLLRLQLSLNHAQAAQVKANKMRKEYNALLRAGATQEQLRAKLAELNAAEVEAAQVTPLQEQVKLQEQLLQQMIELARAQAELATGGGGGDGGGAGGGGGIDIPPIDTGGISQSIDDLLAALQKKVQDKLGEIWQSVVDKWNEKVGPALENLKVAWGMFVNSLRDAWSALTQSLANLWDIFAYQLHLPTADAIMALWEDFDGTFSSLIDNLLETWDLFATALNLPTSEEIKIIWHKFLSWIEAETKFWTEKITKWWEDHGDSVIKIGEDIIGFIATIFTEAIRNFGEFVKLTLDFITTFWRLHGDDVNEIMARAFEQLGLLFDAVAAALEGDWETFWDKLREISVLGWIGSKQVWDMMSPYIADVMKSISDEVDREMKGIVAIFTLLLAVIEGEIEREFTAIFDIAKLQLELMVGEIQREMEIAKSIFDEGLGIISDIWVTFWEGYSLILSDALASLESYMTDFYNIGRDLIDQMIDGANSMGQALIQAVIGLVQDAIAAIIAALGGAGGPTYGGEGFAGGQGVAGRGGIVAQRPIAAQPVMAGNTLNFSMNGITINNALDVAQLRALVRQEMARGL